jgi:hypothetical protein
MGCPACDPIKAMLVSCVVMFAATMASGVPGNRAPICQLEISCVPDVCGREMSLGFLDAVSGELIAHLMVELPFRGPIPESVVNEIMARDVSPDGVTLSALNGDVVFSSVSLTDACKGVQVSVWPSSTLVFEVRSTRRNGGSPSSRDGGWFEVYLWPSDGSGGQDASFSASCRAERASARCKVPAGVWDLRVERPGWISQPMWSVEADRDATVELGTIELEPAATVTGVVEIGGAIGVNPASRGTVDVLPAASIAYEGRDEKRRRSRVMRKSANLADDGTFSITGVVIGQNLIQAAVEGVGTSLLRRFRVGEPSTFELREPLVIVPRVEVRLEVGPARWAGGTSLVATLAPVGGSPEAERITVNLDSASPTVLPQLIPGDYLLQISDAANQFLFRDVISIAATTSMVTIDIEQVPIAGFVSLDGEPLAHATLVFAGRNGESIEMQADRKGRFDGLLPSGGMWHVSVASDTPFVRNTSQVDIHAGGVLEIPLETTGIEGAVVDEVLEPAEGARVVVIGGAPVLQRGITYTDADGLYEVIGLPPGEYLVEVSTEFHQSDFRMVEVESGEVVNLEHRMDNVRIAVRGQVVDSQGNPVHRASVSAFSRSMQDDPLGLSASKSTSGEDGGFVLELHPDAFVARITVDHAGFDLAVSGDLLVPVDKDEALTIVLEEPMDGTLELEWMGVRPDLLLFNGRAVSMGVLDGRIDHQSRPRQASSRGSATVNGMAAGTYAACYSDPISKIRALSGVPSNRTTGEGLDCAEVYLSPGGRVRLTAPEAAD